MHIDTIMDCTMLCMRKNPTAGHASMIQASKADAKEQGLIVHASFLSLSTSRTFKAVDMIHKNSVLAEDNKPIELFRNDRADLESLCQGVPVHIEGNPS
jgi:hypothetical protein